MGRRPPADRLQIDRERQEVKVGGRPLDLSPKEFAILSALAAAPGRLLRRHELAASIWGREDAVIPLSVGEAYNKSIRGSRLAVLDRCGHRPEIEKTGDFVKLLRDFLS